MKDLKDDRKE